MPVPVFPTLPSPSLPYSRTPIWRTLVVETLAGVEVNQQAWSYPRYRYKIGSGFLRDNLSFAELQTLIAFYNTCGGRAQVFRFLDAQDSSAGPDQPLGLGNGSQTQFQLLRSFGGYTEPVFAPNVVTNVKVAGVAQSTPGQYSIDAKGLITFVTAPGNGLLVTWTGTYYWYCRFDQDEQEFEVLVAALAGDPWGNIWDAAALSFTTQKFGV